MAAAGSQTALFSSIFLPVLRAPVTRLLKRGREEPDEADVRNLRRSQLPRLNHKPENGQNEERGTFHLRGEKRKGRRDQVRAGNRGKDDERPLEENEHHERSQDGAHQDRHPTQLWDGSSLKEKIQVECTRHRSCEPYRNLLHENRQDGTRNSCNQPNNQKHFSALRVDQRRHEVCRHDKSQRGDEEPEKAASRDEQQGSEHNGAQLHGNQIRVEPLRRERISG